jgi:hypothetical protein
MIKILKHLIVLIFTIKIGTCCFSKSESDFKTKGTTTTKIISSTSSITPTITENPSRTFNQTTTIGPTTTTIQPLGKS